MHSPAGQPWESGLGDPGPDDVRFERSEIPPHHVAVVGDAGGDERVDRVLGRRAVRSAGREFGGQPGGVGGEQQSRHRGRYACARREDGAGNEAGDPCCQRDRQRGQDGSSTSRRETCTRSTKTIAERIYEKIAEQARRSRWDGGRQILGYVVTDKRLVIDETLDIEAWGRSPTPLNIPVADFRSRKLRNQDGRHPGQDSNLERPFRRRM